MCGFMGFFGGDTDIHRDGITLKEMTDSISHRGPDDEEYYTDGDYSVGFRRLSIIDLAGGVQPMTNEDDSKVLVFNGEIYNFAEIRESLLAAGHMFKTRSDSEVLLHGYEEYGTELLPKLRGMFAFVIYDKEKKELFGARDFFGIKPLYFAEIPFGAPSGAVSDSTNKTSSTPTSDAKTETPSGTAFLFGSEIKGFLNYPKFEKKLNQKALEHYLSFQYSPGPETFFEGVLKVTPGHWFKYNEQAGYTEQRYWIPEFAAEEDKSLDYWVAEIEKTFDDSVAAHKISDVEVGSFLSSGVDSSYVACSAGVDKTFTVGFASGEKYNEIDYAQELSGMIPVKNISKVITPEEYWSNFPKIQYHMDEPLADPSAAALYFVAGKAAEYVKVVLSGEGADEIFGGYNIYKEPLELPLYGKLPFGLQKAIGKVASKLPARRGVNFLVRRGRRIEDRFIGNAYMFTTDERRALLKNPAMAEKPEEKVRPWYEMMKDKDNVTKMQFVDLNMWMVGDILLKADKMSMAHSLELRVPFLDKHIMALAGRIPLRYRVNKENTKYAMRLAASRRMPEKWSSKRKLGFPVPTRVWLAEDEYYAKVKESFLSATAEKYFHTDKLVALLDEHRAGKADNSRKIWTVYTFLVWYGVYFADAATQSA